MVVIRMARGGAKKKPFYSIVVTDSRKPRDSGYIERIGYFNPVARGKEVRLNLEEDKLISWQNKGAKLSDRVKQLVKEFKNPEIRAKAVVAIEMRLKARNDKKIAAEKAKIAQEAVEQAKVTQESEVETTKQAKIETEEKVVKQAKAEAKPIEETPEQAAETPSDTDKSS